MNRFLALSYGAVSYLLFLVVFVYAILFVGDLVVPRTIDDAIAAPVGQAVAVDVVLLALFALQHSVMARPAFKTWWTRIVPQPVERSTYVLFSTLALALLCWQWRPITAPVWHVAGPVAATLLTGLSLFGWLLALFSTFLINHFELFGLQQVVSNLAARKMPATEFRTPLLYNFVRHPLYLGFIVAFWATPAMSAGRLLFAAVTTTYIFVGIFLEERDLVDLFGDDYRRYRQRVAMIVPRLAPWRR
jgi:protein-S-isoprenylcysteine O-methyltransferase Ste14